MGLFFIFGLGVMVINASIIIINVIRDILGLSLTGGNKRYFEQAIKATTTTTMQPIIQQTINIHYSSNTHTLTRTFAYAAMYTHTTLLLSRFTQFVYI